MANLLTAVRLILVLPVSWGFAVPGSMPALLLPALILLAIATDFFDGKLARALGTASARGMLFDHTTDFLFVTAALAGAAYAGAISPLLPALIVIAFSQYVLDSYFLYQQKQLRISFLGLLNGILYFVPLVVLAVAGLIPNETLRNLLLVAVQWLGYALIASTIASIIDRALAPLRSKKPAA